MEILFNFLFVILIILFYGDLKSEAYFNPLYKKLSGWTEPVYRFARGLFSADQKAGAHILFILLFLILRALHYYSYRHETAGMMWGPVMLVWKDPAFLASLTKSVLSTALFYYHMLVILLLLDWGTGGEFIGNPLWKLLHGLTLWVKNIGHRISNSFHVKMSASFLFLVFLFSLLFFGVLISFGGKMVLVPGGSGAPALLPKIVILNLFLAENIFRIYFYLFFFRAILSWFFPYGAGGAGDLIFRLTDPLMDKLSRWNLRAGPFDFSALILMLASLFMDQLCANLLIRLYLIL